MNLNLDDLNALVRALLNRAGRKAFIDEAISIGHQRSEAGHRYALLMIQLMQNYNERTRV